ncbi:DUF2877 domain-containing protein [Microlunatus elymi]|uniref:DUF2877 domain-containing protein n=1 Tax=Microlunatus elymi TaxID=2596828 RepID=A0A516Q2W1_9ACTN|nr:DUF2877 domain-containing protein [Microlunatus elymi]QDP97756.1 DUF2877 domain-containing protein [Microlunatus elymi]
MISPSPAPIMALEVTDPVRAALADRRGPDQILGRYRTGLNLLVDELVVYASAGPISSPAGIRVDAATLARLLDGPDLVAGIDTSAAVVVETKLAAWGTDPEQVGRICRAAVPALAKSWFTDTPEELSARSAIGLLCKAIHHRDQDQIPTRLRTLLGRGIGLTPSGDDAVVGILAAAIGAGEFDDGTWCSFRSLLSKEGARLTTKVSLSTLNCAVDGQVSPALRQLIMTAAGPRADVNEEVVTAVAAHGHTSGCDALYGVVTYWQELFGPNANPVPTRS